MRIVFQGLLVAFNGEIDDKGQGRIVERPGRGAGDCTRHVGDAIMDDIVNDVGRVSMGGWFTGFKTATLINRHIDDDRAFLHLFDHVFGHQPGRGGARDQHRTDHQISADDILLNGFHGCVNGIKRRPKLHI